VCPNEALTVVGKTMTVDEVIAEVVRDRDYYEVSGGGLTVSGGEPMVQFEFTRALLVAAHEQAIHTCLDTCGFAPQDRYAALLEHVDVFLYDYKATDPALHERLTGVDNRLVLENLELLLARGKRVILRCPLVPGENDQPEHLRAIAAVGLRHPELEIELMAYHAMGAGKAQRVGMTYELPGLRTVEREQSEAWLSELTSHGYEKARLG
jgi:pyruvate formate lyase activating enzyme